MSDATNKLEAELESVIKKHYGDKAQHALQLFRQDKSKDEVVNAQIASLRDKIAQSRMIDSITSAKALSTDTAGAAASHLEKVLSEKLLKTAEKNVDKLLKDRSRLSLVKGAFAGNVKSAYDEMDGREGNLVSNTYKLAKSIAYTSPMEAIKKVKMRMNTIDEVKDSIKSVNDLIKFYKLQEVQGKKTGDDSLVSSAQSGIEKLEARLVTLKARLDAKELELLEAELTKYEEDEAKRLAKQEKEITKASEKAAKAAKKYEDAVKAERKGNRYYERKKKESAVGSAGQAGKVKPYLMDRSAASDKILTAEKLEKLAAKKEKADKQLSNITSNKVDEDARNLEDRIKLIERTMITDSDGSSKSKFDIKNIMRKFFLVELAVGGAGVVYGALTKIYDKYIDEKINEKLKPDNVSQSDWNKMQHGEKVQTAIASKTGSIISRVGNFFLPEPKRKVKDGEMSANSLSDNEFRNRILSTFIFSGTDAVDFFKMDKALQSKILAVAQDPQTKVVLAKAGVGQIIRITSTYRSEKKQKELHAQWVAQGSKPTSAIPYEPALNSPHIRGKAIDINAGQANALDSSGILARYGLHRPVKRDPVHITMISDIVGDTIETKLTASSSKISESKMYGKTDFRAGDSSDKSFKLHPGNSGRINKSISKDEVSDKLAPKTGVAFSTEAAYLSLGDIDLTFNEVQTLHRSLPKYKTTSNSDFNDILLSTYKDSEFDPVLYSKLESMLLSKKVKLDERRAELESLGLKTDKLSEQQIDEIIETKAIGNEIKKQKAADKVALKPVEQPPISLEANKPISVVEAIKEQQELTQQTIVNNSFSSPNAIDNSNFSAPDQIAPPVGLNAFTGVAIHSSSSLHNG